MSVSLGDERHCARAPSPGGYRVARTRRNSMREYRPGVTSPHTPSSPLLNIAPLRVSLRSSFNPLASSALRGPLRVYVRSSTSALSQRASTNVVLLLCVFLCHPLSLSLLPLSFCVCPRFLFVAPATSFPRHPLPSLPRFSCEPHRPSPAPGSNDSRTRAPQVFPQILPTVSVVSFARLFARIRVTQVHLSFPVPFTSRASLCSSVLSF